ncbi:MAG: exodeoxyribonuclease V subunit alpha [Proteobacteria bacterium]|nr:MAG: exodeoxyribonuclease V subunit alpha [Pseudomonadota bacterium]
MTLFEKMRATELFSSIDLHFAEFMARQSGSTVSEELENALFVTAALLSRAVQQGHICLSRTDLENERQILETKGIGFQKNDLDLVARSDGVALAEEVRKGEVKPLVLAGGSLYLYRYFQYEENMMARLDHFSGTRELNAAEREVVSRHLNDSRLFQQAKGVLNWQKVAAFYSVKNRLSIISGGPGTGKTTTLAKILCMLYEMNPTLKIALAAPTGKAAARMGEAVVHIKKMMLEQIPEMEEAIGRIPEDTGLTIHRMLGTRQHSLQFRYNREKRLPHDVVIVDECSMIPVPLMSKLLDAVRDDARLILLGDKDQLASVEAGRCFGDLCDSSAINTFSKELADEYVSFSGEVLPTCKEKRRSLVQLQQSYRFPDASAVGRISRLINRGDRASAGEAYELAVSEASSKDDIPVIWHENGDHRQMLKELEPLILSNFSQVVAAQSAQQALRALAAFRVLACVKKGPYGVNQLNSAIEAILEKNKLIDRAEPFYENRPVMVLQNSYAAQLFNGDIGIVRSDPAGHKRVYFPPLSDGEERSFLPSVLPEHETVFAMTIHKSQGSEFDSVMLVLPIHESPVLTRELLYTGITRTKGRVELFSTRRMFIAAAVRKVARNSGWSQRHA